jgi:hypothetical protein
MDAAHAGPEACPETGLVQFARYDFGYYNMLYRVDSCFNPSFQRTPYRSIRTQADRESPREMIFRCYEVKGA